MHELSYTLSRGTTRIVTGKSVKEYIGQLPENSLIVYPETLSSLVESFSSGLKVSRLKIKDGEDGKSLESVIRIIEVMHEAGFRRNSTVVSVGGGSTSDTVGMAASMYMRGIRYIAVPTTLLSMVDASLGGKNAVNFRGVKNLVGSFYSPTDIMIDVSLIREMPDNLVTDGMGEIAKYALIMDENLYSDLNSKPIEEIFRDRNSLENLVLSCVKDKMGIVEKDEFDLLGERIILNFGHTFGHAIESAMDFAMGHGTAVALGMLLELDMAVKLGLIGRDILDSASGLLGKLKLPSKIDSSFFEPLKDGMKRVISSDKKALQASVKMPLPTKPGHPEVHEINLKDIGDYLDGL